MKVLFVHPNFPAQYRHVAATLADDPANEVVFLCKTRRENLPNVRKVVFKPKREAHSSTHYYIREMEAAVLNSQAVYQAVRALKAKGFVPDVVCGHIGWGVTFFIKDVFPDTPFLLYSEWFYHAHGADTGFDPETPQSEDDVLRIRAKNTPLLLAMDAADWGLAPTEWQRSQFPEWYRQKVTVLHDGIDTAYLQPAPRARLVLPNLDLSYVDELVTYVARGLEPYRGFHKFLEAVALIQKRRPHCHAVIVGEDRVFYGKKLPDGKGYKEIMLQKVPLDLSRVHFTGRLSYDQYRQVLQASSVHVYLTVPFILSWSMLEAMSVGGLVLASDTRPVTEVIRDGENGLLVDFFSPEAIADRVEEVLEHPTRLAEIRRKARETLLERYALADLLPRHVRLIQDVASRRLPGGPEKRVSSGSQGSSKMF